MSNFSFIKADWSQVYDDCARAESYLTTDPRSACFYSRRAIEVLVRHLYDVLQLDPPYKDDLNALLNHHQFTAEAGPTIATKLNLIRKLGNTAVHDTKPIPRDASLHALRELFHVMIWAAFRYSTNPQSVPTKAQFDAGLAAQLAPLSHDEVINLAKKFQAQDEAHAKALSERDELLTQHEAQIATLRAEIKTAQLQLQKTDNHDYSEAETRDAFIDVLLNEAGWLLTDNRDREYEVTGMPTSSGKGLIDYVLWGADGRPLALVEAKRTTKSAEVGRQQAMLYADCLEKQFGRRPVIFYTNGYEHWVWDDNAGYPPRPIQGFFTRDELELLLHRRAARQPLSTTPINNEIVERPYQVRAIKAVDDAFEKRQREALLVMATGSGKTRTVIALVDQLMKANWVKRALFLADRTGLVVQAANAFKTHLPSATTVNLVTEKNTDGRVFVSTYPTIMNMINQVDESGRRFGPGYFDLIVIDEAHRSVYAKYRAIFDYFDSLLVGLTATPKDDIDHNTYRLFHLEDGVPTDAYSLEEATTDGYLVPARGVSVGTQFLRHGIKYDDLSDVEKDEWDALEWGDDGPPAEVGVEEINRFLFNEDTVEKVLATLMSDGIKVAGGDRIGKTIIFAKSQAHAEFIQQRFDIGWPQHGGQLARVITHNTSYAQSLIDSFSVKDSAPHIAISVDMLDTGIDVPEIVNLVFFKLVRSKSKFWQMIGRGTRLCEDLFGPGSDKKNFLVFDFCGNLEFFSQDLPPSEGSLQKSLSQRIYEARLELVTSLDAADTIPSLRESAADLLHGFVAGMTLDNVLVRPHRRAVERFADRVEWSKLNTDDANLALTLAGLPTSATDPDESAKRFDILMLRRQLAQLHGDNVVAERAREAAQAIASELLTKTTIPSVAAQSQLLDLVAGDEWWIDVTLEMIELARLRIRGLAQFVSKETRVPVYTDFQDTLTEPSDVSILGVTPGTDFTRFREKAQSYLRKHQDHLALRRLRGNRPLTTADLGALQSMLVDSGGRDVDLRWVDEQGGIGVFVRSLVGLDRGAVTEAFAKYLDGTRYNVNQVRFVNLIVDELTTAGIMTPDRLFESPYTDHAPTGPDDVFVDAEVTDLVQILDTVKANAEPHDVA